MRLPLLATAAFILVLAPAEAQTSLPIADASSQLPALEAPRFNPNAVTRVQATRRSDHIDLDGRHEDVAWQTAEVISEFTQRDPIQGASPSEKTEVRVVYDDEALYISARMYDSAPDSIVARLGRRDADIESDHFVIFLDPYRDLRTGFYFGVNAAGTLYDGVLMNDDWDDEDWDGVWDAEVHRDDKGWCAEFRIPFSQLRFRSADEHTWGINFRRSIARKNERNYLVYTPRDGSGFVSRFPELTGLQNIHPRRQIEAVPYVTSRAEYLDHDDADPFNDGSRYVPGVGADFKVGVTSNLTLNATVNPDFGQVEVDPAVVNLSDVETFFPEKRPFFIEGNSIFNGFGNGGANNNWGFNWGSPRLFYSRRIGRAPQGNLPDNDFSERVDGTRILGAAKLTGRVGQGWNVGMIQSLTERSNAEFDIDGERLSAEVEPLAYYGVYRGQKEFADGRQAFGFQSTLSRRDFRDEGLERQINKSASTFALDGYTFLDKDKVWVLTGWVGGSRVTGSKERITDLQRSSLHYFQRPDADAVSVDSAATSMQGSAGRLALNKQKGSFTTNVALGFISPGFDSNDLGFLFRTNVINGHAVGIYRWTNPSSWYRKLYLYSSVFGSWDFDGNATGRGVWAAQWLQFLNYHELWVNVAANPETVNNRLTRGGPLTKNQPGFEANIEYDTDSRKRLVFEWGGFTYLQKDSWNLGLYHETVFQPASNLSLSINPRLTFNNEFAQWVGGYDDPLATRTFGRRYVFAELEQVTFSSSLRMNWTFTPQLSVQLFAQPLISAGEYANYKELRNPKSFDFINYGQEGSTIDLDELVADPDGSGPAAAIDLPQQDFNFRSLRGTAVLRWEYRPGSTLFLVWTQSRSDFEEIGDLRFGRSVDDLIGAKADNIFAIKLTYWLSR